MISEGGSAAPLARRSFMEGGASDAIQGGFAAII